MEKVNLPDKQSGTNECNSNLLHLNVLSEIISLLDPNEEEKTSFTKKGIAYDDKSFTISKVSYVNETSLYVSCGDGRKLIIKIISNNNQNSDSNQASVELSVSFSNLGTEFLCFTRNINYDTFSTLSPDSLATILERLSWGYIEKNKDKLFSEEELDFICDTITTKTRKESEMDVYRKRALDCSMKILQETLEGPKKKSSK